MAAWTANTAASNLMFAQQPFFLANIEESRKFGQRVTSRSNAGVAKEGNMFYVKETAAYAKGFATRPFTTETMSRPTAYPPTLALPTWQCYDYWHPVDIAGKLMTQGELIGMIDARSAYMKTEAECIAWYQEVNLAGAHNGLLAKVKTTSNAVTVDVEDASKCRVGMIVDFIATSTTAYGSASITSQTITGVNLQTNVLTFGGSQNVTAGWYVTLEDSAQLMGTGLMDLVNDGNDYSAGGIEVILGQSTYAGLTKSSTPGWNSYIESLNGGLTDRAFNQFLGNAQMFYNGLDLPWTAAYVNPKTYGYMKSVLAPNFRTMTSTDNTIRLGALGVELWIPEAKNKQMAVVSIPALPPNCIIFVDETDLGIRYPMPPGWRMTDGQILRETTNDGGSATTFGYRASFIGIEALIGHPHRHGALVFNAAAV